MTLSIARLKYALFLLGAAPACWLIFAPPPSDARWAALQLAYDRGSIGHLPKPQTDALKKSVEWLSKYAHLTGEVTVNERPRPGYLNIITTSAEAADVTGCAPGNALYDQQLDTIFIDEHIAWPRDVLLLGSFGPRTMFSEDSLGFPLVYLRFVLLHELGHRYLHHGKSALFDAHGGERSEEEAADQFAVDSLHDAYSADLRLGVNHRPSNAGVALRIAGSHPRSTENVWVDLIATVASMSVALMYSGGDYSSFYQDAAHPTFFDRADRIFSLAIRSPEVSDALKSNAAFYRESLSQTRALVGHGLREIHVRGGVQSVTFDSSGALMLTNHGDLYRSKPACRLQYFCDDNGSNAVLMARGPFANVDEYSASSNLWATTDEGAAILRQDEAAGDKVMIAVAPNSSGKYEEIRSLSDLHNDEPWEESLILPPQPSAAVILGRSTRDSGRYWVIRGRSVTAKGFWNEIREAVRARLGAPAAEVDVSTMTDDMLYLTVMDPSPSADDHEQMTGVAGLSLNENRIVFASKLQFSFEGGGEAINVRGDRLIVAPQNGKPRFILLTRNLSSFIAFEVFADRAMHQLAAAPFILEALKLRPNAGLSSEVVAAFDPTLFEAQWAPPGYIVAAFDGDAVFSLNLASNRITTIFNPANSSRFAVGASGTLAFFARNGYKVYLRSLEEVEK